MLNITPETFSRDNSLDFLIIGAQKSGTTSLFDALKKHPSIRLPLGKEAPILHRDGVTREEFREFVAGHFPHSTSIAVKGKISPQYMTNWETAQRVKEFLPSAKLIAILRDPVQRTVSHYRMNKRRGREDRDINQAILECLGSKAVENARLLPAGPGNERECYVAWSEYGRILNYYFKLYSSEDIKVVFLEDFSSDPGKVIDAILKFLGLAPGYRQFDSTAKFVSSDVERFPNLRDAVKSSGILSKVYRSLPVRYRSYISFSFERWNSSSGTKGTNSILPAMLSSDVQEMLRDHYRKDAVTLMNCTGVERLPWIPFAGKTGSQS